MRFETCRNGRRENYATNFISLFSFHHKFVRLDILMFNFQICSLNLHNDSSWKNWILTSANICTLVVSPDIYFPILPTFIWYFYHIFTRTNWHKEHKYNLQVSFSIIFCPSILKSVFWVVLHLFLSFTNLNTWDAKTTKSSKQFSLNSVIDFENR